MRWGYRLVSVYSDGFYYRKFGDSEWIKIQVNQEVVNFVDVENGLTGKITHLIKDYFYSFLNVFTGSN